MKRKDCPVLVKFRAYEDFISIRTITREDKSTQSFDLLRTDFTALEADGHIVVKDRDSFADIRLIDEGATVQIEFAWIIQNGKNTITGFTQTVTLDYDTLAKRIWDSLELNGGPTQWSMLSVDRTRKQARLDFSNAGAQATIKGIIADPRIRRALSRAVRDYFMWPNSGDLTVRFYADYVRHSFFFKEYRGGERGICGRLILHPYYYYDDDDLYKYQVHT